LNDDFTDRVFIPFTVVVLACLEPPFGIGLLSLGQELAADFRKPSPGDAAYPLTCSLCSPSPVLKLWLIAREKFATALPLLVYRSSASAPVLPMSMTLLTPISGI
jgi:hypothetical protein